MARRTTISKEMILEAALKMLIRDGYQAVNIKTLAAEIGCSTQPIAWHFENMDEMRRELALFAEKYAEGKIVTGAGNAAGTFETMGRAYVHMAIHEPNLFKFLYLGERPINKPFTAESIAKSANSKELIAGIAAQTGLSETQAAGIIRNIVIYSHGLATMIATGVLKLDESEAMAMISEAANSFSGKNN